MVLKAADVRKPSVFIKLLKALKAPEILKALVVLQAPKIPKAPPPVVLKTSEILKASVFKPLPEVLKASEILKASVFKLFPEVLKAPKMSCGSRVYTCSCQPDWCESNCCCRHELHQ